MTYINSKIFLNALDIFNGADGYKKYSWFLIGNPSDAVMAEKDYYNKESSSYNIDERGKFTFKDYNIAAISNFVDYEDMDYSIDVEEGSFTYKFSGNTINNTGVSCIFSIMAGNNTTDDYGFNDKMILCLCALKEDYIENISNKLIYNASDEKNGLFKQFASGNDVATVYEPNFSNDNNDYIYNEFITDVIVAYSVSTGVVNGFNYSGYVVGETSVKISGLLKNTD